MVVAHEDIALQPGDVPFWPRGPFYDLFYVIDLNKWDEIFLDGPAGTGKTKSVLVKIFNIGDEYPGTSILICRKTRESMTKTCLVTFEEQILAIACPEAYAGRDRNQRDSYKMPNGTRYEICGATDIERIKSGEFDIIYVNEVTDLTERDYAYLTTRLRKRNTGADGGCPFKLIISDCNPSYPSHWANKRFDKTDPEYHSIPSRRLRLTSQHEDNPMLWDDVAKKWTDDDHGGGERYIRILDSLPYTDRMRMRWGKWIGETGLVYPEFIESYHVIPRCDVPPIAYHVGAIDWGITAAGVLQIWGIDDEERGYLLRLVHAYDRGIDWWAEKAVALYHKYRPRLILCDPARRDIRELFNNRIGARYDNPMSRICIPSNNEREAGIHAIKSGLTRELHAKDCPKGCPREDRHGKARMYIVKDCLEQIESQVLVDDTGKTRTRTLGIVHEFQTLPWKKTKEGQEVKEEWDASIPHDCLDATRYFGLYNERKNTSTRRARTQNPHKIGSPAYVMWQEGRRIAPKVAG